MLKEGQHGRIVKMAKAVDVPVHVTYDREIERYTVTPDQLERLLALAVMAGENPFAAECGEEHCLKTGCPNCHGHKTGQRHS